MNNHLRRNPLKKQRRRHGLRRCLYPGLDGMRRWVGLAVIADNVIQMECYCAAEHLSRHSPPLVYENGRAKITAEDHIGCVLLHRAYVRKCIFATKSS
jgi:hypothetical protein